MSNENFSTRLLLPVLIIVCMLAAFSRLLPHPYNISAIGAIALFSGAFIANRRWGFIIPLAAVVLSDFFLELQHPGLGFYPEQGYVYAAYLLVACVGWFIRKRQSLLNVVFASLTGSLVFFLVSNFGSWLYITSYSRDFSGLLDAYIAAIPFAK